MAMNDTTTPVRMSTGFDRETPENLNLYLLPNSTCSCRNPIRPIIYRAYQEALVKNIKQVNTQTATLYNQFLINVKDKTDAYYLVLNLYNQVDQILDHYFTTGFGSTGIALADLLSELKAGNITVFTELINSINQLNAELNHEDDITTFSHRVATQPPQNLEFNYDQEYLTLISQTTPLLNQVVQGLEQAVNIYNDTTTIDEALISNVVTVLNQLQTVLVDTEYDLRRLTDSYTPPTSKEMMTQLEKIQTDGKHMLGRLNDKAFNELGVGSPCCRRIYADIVRRGLDVQKVDEETAYVLDKLNQ